MSASVSQHSARADRRGGCGQVRGHRGRVAELGTQCRAPGPSPSGRPQSCSSWWGPPLPSMCRSCLSLRGTGCLAREVRSGCGGPNGPAGTRLADGAGMWPAPCDVLGAPQSTLVLWGTPWARTQRQCLCPPCGRRGTWGAGGVCLALTAPSWSWHLTGLPFALSKRLPQTVS